jgi:hypothetical protein
MPWQMSIVNGASKCLQARPFRTEALSFMIIMVPMVWFSHALLLLCVIVPWAVPSVYLRF